MDNGLVMLFYGWIHVDLEFQLILFWYMLISESQRLTLVALWIIQKPAKQNIREI